MVKNAGIPENEKTGKKRIRTPLDPVPRPDRRRNAVLNEGKVFSKPTKGGAYESEISCTLRTWVRCPIIAS